MESGTSTGAESGLARDKADEWVGENALRAVAVAAAPIPGGHSIATTAVELYMIINVATIYGQSLTLKEALAVIPALGAVMGAGKLMAMAAGEWLTFLPGPGWLAKGGLGGTIAYLIGKRSISYFENKYPNQQAAPFKITFSVKDILSYLISDGFSKK